MQGAWVETQEEVEEANLQFYKGVLGSSDDKRTKVSSSIVKEGKLLTTEQQSELCKRFNAEEVKAALFDIEDNKAHGPDGYSSYFYKKA